MRMMTHALLAALVFVTIGCCTRTEWAPVEDGLYQGSVRGIQVEGRYFRSLETFSLSYVSEEGDAIIETYRTRLLDFTDDILPIDSYQ